MILVSFRLGRFKVEENQGKWDYGRVFKIYYPPVFETKYYKDLSYLSA